MVLFTFNNSWNYYQYYKYHGVFKNQNEVNKHWKFAFNAGICRSFNGNFSGKTFYFINSKTVGMNKGLFTTSVSVDTWEWVLDPLQASTLASMPLHWPSVWMVLVYINVVLPSIKASVRADTRCEHGLSHCIKGAQNIN